MLSLKTEVSILKGSAIYDITAESFEHPEKAQLPIVLSSPGSSILSRLEQLLYLQLVVYQFVLIKTVEK